MTELARIEMAISGTLFSYVLRPGAIFFLGFDSNYDKPEPGPYARRDYSVFNKFSYWWRL